jgi:prophage antirepressor-like protein
VKIITQDFNGANIRFVLDSSKEFFVAKDVATLLGYRDTDQAIRKHCKKVVSFLTILKPVETTGLDLISIFGANYKNVKLIPEGDVWRLIARSRLPEAEKIEEWIFEEVLPSIRKTGSYSLNKENELEKNLIALKFAQENLAVSEEDRVKMARDLFESLGLQNQYLPTYVDGEPAFSLTHLLKKFGVKMSSQKVYLLLESENIIEKKSRKSSKKRMVKDKKGDEKEENILKTFWSIKDEKFGKNSVNSHGTSRQTQILFYEKTFEELLQKLELTQQIS